jgi:hypothetical protein
MELNHDVIDAQRGTAANSCMRMGTRRWTKNST